MAYRFTVAYGRFVKLVQEPGRRGLEFRAVKDMGYSIGKRR